MDPINSRHTLKCGTGYAGYRGNPSAQPDKEMIFTACARCGKRIHIPSQSAHGRPVLCEECYLAYQRIGGAI